MMLFAWTAAFAIYGCLMVIMLLLGMYLVIVCCTTGRVRRICEAILAMVGLALALLFS